VEDLVYGIELLVGMACLAVAALAWRRGRGRLANAFIALTLGLAGLVALVHAVVRLAACDC
jgi:hypothetical protein